MNYYIHLDEFITTDTEINVVTGTTLEDFKAGKYILMNQDLINYMNNHPDASPLEVLVMRQLTTNDTALSPQVEAMKWFNLNCEYLLINNEKIMMFDWRYLLEEVVVYKELQEQEMYFLIHEHKYKGNTQDVYNFILQYAKYCLDLDSCKEDYFRFIDNNPDKIDTYDYKSKVPIIVSAFFEKIR